VNANATYPFFNSPHGKSFLKHPYRIGLWVWELPSFQSEWFANFASYDEIWVPSTFCQQAVAAATEKPVHLVPLVVEQQSNVVNNLETRVAFRAKWGIPADKFVFYYMFDASSYIERKNPFAVIEAFREAFVHETGAHLLLKIGYGKSNKPFTRHLTRLLGTLVKGSFTIIEEVLCRLEIDALVVASDCCVSPHRSEGFGLTVAEALFFGKPVVATDFGGTTDFLTPETGYPVAYKLIEIERDIGPYKRGNIWADPLPEALCDAMKAVFRDKGTALSKAQAGARLVRETLSREAVGAVITNVLS
jgi:glycosyltransferase involved in cell wall biosynthesis